MERLNNRNSETSDLVPHLSPPRSAESRPQNGNCAIDLESEGSQRLARSHDLVDDGSCLNLIYKGAGLRFPCICGQAFETCPTLGRHLLTCAKTGQRQVIGQYRCGKCIAVIRDSMSKIAGHFRTCNGSREGGNGSSQPNNGASLAQDAFKCRFCDRCFNTRIGQGQHEKKAHATQFAASAALDKVPRWSDAENDLLVEAEATIRLRNSLTGSREDCFPELAEDVYEYMVEKLPSLRRSLEAVKQRRRKWDQERFTSLVSSRMTAFIESQAGEVSQLQDNACGDGVDQPMDPMDASGSASLPKWSGCSCGAKLEDAISKHLQSLEQGDDAKALDIKSYLHSILLELDAYDLKIFNLVMKRKTAPQRGSGINTSGDTAPTHPHAGKRFAQKLSQCAKVREVFDKQGCKRCLQYLRNPSDSGLCSGETIELFKNMFEDNSGLSSCNEDVPIRPIEARRDPHLVHEPITASEVMVQLRRINKTTAPGPDGVRVSDVQDADPKDLACLFNIFLLHKNVPKGLKANKTTMLPKSGRPGISDWRPITIASIIDRLFAKILEARLSSVIKLDPNQRGFMKSLDGCGENITAYGGALKYARTHAKPLVAVSLDLAKAFDSVHHSIIRKALARLSVDEGSIEMLMNLCSGHTTDIKYADGVANVKLLKGVRQGWPLSPLLFLSVVDELLCSLNPENGFQIKSASLETAQLTGLAFADDLILYSGDECGMRRNLQIAASWCAANGLKINPHKSTVLYLAREPKAKRVVQRALAIDLDGTTIPVVSESFERILGVHMHHTGKVDHKIDHFREDLDLVCSSKLRPSQKIEMIRTCLVPMIKFKLVYGLANKGACNQVDKIVRSAVRKVLHLPNYFANAAMHATKGQGGLGVPCLGEAVPIAQAMLVTRMTNSPNEITKLLVSDKVQSRIFARVPALANPRMASKTASEGLSREFSDKRLKSFKGTMQGEGWSLYHKAPRAFIDCPRQRKWSDRDAIDALKMRSNLLWTRELAARTVARKLRKDVSCRACRLPDSVENQAHLLSRCPMTKPARVGRHDHICAYLAARLNRSLHSRDSAGGARVHREFRVMLKPGEAGYTGRARELRPDIAVVTRDRVVIIEVSVVYEAERGGRDNSLRHVHREKVRKYMPLKKVLSTRFGRPCDVRTLILGCRGGWLSSNSQAFLGTGASLTEEDRRCLIERAVRGSLITYRRFLAHTFGPVVEEDMR